jgi:AraC-like DNA-binding protein
MNQHSPVHVAAVALRDAIIANPLERKTTMELARQYHIDRKKLLPAFKELTGTTIKRFHFEQLMKTASEMLLSGMTVKEVAIECGYQNFQNNFTRGFREFYSVGPDEWLHNKLLEGNKATSNNKGKKVHS